MSATTLAPPPTDGSPIRRAALWIGLAAGALVVLVIVVLVVTQPRPDATGLDPDSGAPSGSRALARVLERQGVDVIPATTLAEVRDAVDDPASTTLLLFDADLVLGGAQREELLDLAAHVVVVAPYDSELAQLAPGVEESAGVYGATTADCPVTAVRNAGTVDANGYGYVAVDDPDAIECLESDGAFGLVQTETDGTRVSVLGLWGVLTNSQITREGNAALALNLLGEHETLIWYLPTVDDVAQEDIPTIAELSPPWVTPLAVLAALVVAAAAVWRGRRLGPLVVEDLPVVVRADETMEGRARLYERSAAREHALDQVRIGTLTRLAARCGLPRAAGVDDVVAAVAALTGRDPQAVRRLLVDEAPATDGDLVRLSDDLLDLEAAAARAVHGN